MKKKPLFLLPVALCFAECYSQQKTALDPVSTEIVSPDTIINQMKDGLRHGRWISDLNGIGVYGVKYETYYIKRKRHGKFREFKDHLPQRLNLGFDSCSDSLNSDCRVLAAV